MSRKGNLSIERKPKSIITDPITGDPVFVDPDNALKVTFPSENEEMISVLLSLTRQIRLLNLRFEEAFDTKISEDDL